MWSQGKRENKKSLYQRKGENETGSKPGLPKKYSNEWIQNKNIGLLRWKSTECHNVCYKYKTKERLELTTHSVTKDFALYLINKQKNADYINSNV